MASAIKPIEAKSVHQIQSGQVIVDLCSVVKELVENALDAEATAIEVRFKNNGLDAIEVQDNGTGISEANYENLALKHYTSKLSTYEDLLNVQTFGFRGEALSSLCALSQFSVVTAQAHEAPKGKRLDFELSGKLRSTSLTAAQKGTTMTVENLFANLPVRQKELAKNIKREYGKVIGLLHAYACISTQVKFTVRNAMPKARSSVVFSTKGNASTRDNIANVYGAKMLAQLIELDLNLEPPPEMPQTNGDGSELASVVVAGHISRPVFGEGRQTPDRQMFFVNGRPCGLPQINKAINEVYKAYNVSQSPFIFADFRMDTSSYDVNVSPDKRTILLHNAAALTDLLKTALTERFDDTEQTVPQSQAKGPALPPYRQLTIPKTSDNDTDAGSNVPVVGIPGAIDSVTFTSIGGSGNPPRAEGQIAGSPKNLLKAHFGGITSTREEPESEERELDSEKIRKAHERHAAKIRRTIEKHEQQRVDSDGEAEVSHETPSSQISSTSPEKVDIPVRDFNARMSEQQRPSRGDTEPSPRPNSSPARRVQEEEIGIVTNAFDRMRPRRLSPEMATITIGDRVVTRMVGTPRNGRSSPSETASSLKSKTLSRFSQRLGEFGAQTDGFAQLVGNESSTDSEHDAESDEAIQKQAPNHKEAFSLASLESGAKILGSVNAEQVNEENERAAEEQRVAELIRAAEGGGIASSKEGQRRANQALKGATSRDSTADQIATLNVDLSFLTQQANSLRKSAQMAEQDEETRTAREDSMRGNEEERLSLTISKADFGKMHIAGQFNLGFIIAVRHKDDQDPARRMDELFIIDQHASDEKYNFERLQADTVVGNQRLVHAVVLDLTAVEEEIVIENEAALQQNGFIIDADDSGELPVGQRCKLLSLPLSKEVTFNMKDLEELIHLLSDSHISANSTYVPRPSKVRKMFAMRACRSSIMIGKTLSRRQMRNVLDHMGRLDKPWNCPHGRPTMRHLTSLDKMNGLLWTEGDGICSDGDADAGLESRQVNMWKSYME